MSQVPPGCRRYSVELRKPLGMVLEEDRHGAIYVVRVLGSLLDTGIQAPCSTPDGIAATAGLWTVW